MRTLFSLTISLFFACSFSFAQSAGPKVYKAPLAGTVVLRDVVDKYNAQVYSLEMPDPDAQEERLKLAEIKKQVSLRFPYAKDPAKKSTANAQPPYMAIGFVADSFSGIPPDNYSAVSKSNTAVSVMNSNIAVHDALTGAYLVRKDLMEFSASVGLNNPPGQNINFRYDPKVVYDPEADRFICLMLNSTLQYNFIVVGFSKTSDPTGIWNFYKFYGDYAADTTWFDYPQISITKHEFFLTGNKIMYDSTWQAGFRKTLIYQMRKQDGYNGDSTLTYQIWDNTSYQNRYMRCLYPVNPGVSVSGPEQYFLSNRNFDLTNDTIFLVKVPDTIGSGNTHLSVTPVVAPLSYGVPPNGRQPDPNSTLATNDGRILGGYMKDDEIQFVSTSRNPVNGASGIYHGIISNVSTAPSMTANIYGYDTLDFGYPNISYTGNSGSGNQSIITFEYCGPRTYPGFGATYFDGAAYSNMLKIKTGDNSIRAISGIEQRWGDYSGSQPDWNETGVVWAEGIFGRKDHNYGNYMAKLVSPAHVGVPVVVTPKATAGLVYPNPAWDFVSYDFNVSAEQGFSFIVYDIQGKVVDKILEQYCHEGKNTIHFNVSPLPVGTFILKAIGRKGETIDVHSFEKR